MTVLACTGEFKTMIDGGHATEGSIANPTSLALDADGNLHIANPVTVSRVDAVTGAITIVAGGGASAADGSPATQARIHGSFELALDTQEKCTSASMSSLTVLAPTR